MKATIRKELNACMKKRKAESSDEEDEASVNVADIDLSNFNFKDDVSNDDAHSDGEIDKDLDISEFEESSA